jgi:predicted NUDIX family NTP pyrophosphohydrolase
MLVTASLAAIDSGDIFLVQNEEGFWTLPGGKKELGETERLALTRELSQELARANCTIGSFWNKVESVTPTSKQAVEVHVFLGSISGDVSPTAEVKASGWFSPQQLEQFKISPPTREILDKLISEGRL